MTRLILLDIFSYSCMNCLRSYEFIKKINYKYKKYGLETIIIHPPEWHFEKDSDNILHVFKKLKINLPVIIDKNKNILRKFKINFWPSQILIRDNANSTLSAHMLPKGTQYYALRKYSRICGIENYRTKVRSIKSIIFNKKIIYTHIGEGSYKKLEEAIIKNLKIKTKRLFQKEPKYSKFPMVYCGNRKGKPIGLDGWIQRNEYIESIKDNAQIIIKAKGKITSFVAESLTKEPIKVIIRISNRFNKKITVKNPQLYNLIKININKFDRFAITAPKNLAIYSFSFQ